MEMKEGFERLSYENERMSSATKSEIKAEIKALSSETKAEIKALSSEMKAEIKALYTEIRDVNKALSTEIPDVNNRFVPIYVFLALFTTASGMANFKDFLAFFT